MMARRWLLVVLCGVIVLILVTTFVFREFDFGTSLPGGFPEDVPIVPGTITSCKTARSDDLVRVVEDPHPVRPSLPGRRAVLPLRVRHWCNGALEHP